MNKGKKMRRNLLIAIFIMFIAMGYALLSANLDISGIYGIKSMKWDVVFENPVLSENSVGTVPTISNKTTLNYSFTIDNPEDFYEATFDVSNKGTINAIVYDIENGVYDSDGYDRVSFPDYLDYSITNITLDSKVIKGQVLNAKSTQQYKVRVSVKNGVDLSKMPLEAESYQFKMTITYAQKKKGVESDYTYYDGVASLSEAVPDLWVYEITDSDSHEASITGFNEYYKAVLDEYGYIDDHIEEAFVDYCGYNGGDYCDVDNHNDIPELRRIVFPAVVKLNSEGKYSISGEEYTITDIDISNGGNYNVSNGIQELIFPNTVQSIRLDTSYGYRYLQNIKLPNNLSSFPQLVFDYDTYYSDSTVPRDIKIPGSIGSILRSPDGYSFYLYSNNDYCEYDYNDDKYKTFGETENGINIYLPSEIDSIDEDAFEFSNIAKIYVETKNVEEVVNEAIDSYCEYRYDSYSSDCYSDVNMCKKKIKKRVVFDPTRF